MTSEEIIDIVLRWAHILGAIVLVGGIFYQWFVVRQVSSSIPENDTGRTSHEQQRRRWSILVMSGITLILVSGLVNTALVSIRYDFDGGGTYHALLAVKLVLALAVFFLASVLTGRSALAERLRASRTPWLTYLVALSFLTIMVASVMKNIDRVPKDRENVGDAEAE